MPTSKCTVIVASIGPGGLTTKSACGRPAIQKIGRRAYCDLHIGVERQRLHLDELAQGARIVLTRTLDGTKFHLEPSGVVVRSNIFHELAALGWLIPEPDTLFPDLELQAQVWRLIPGARV